MHSAKAPKEQSNLLIFLPLVLIAVFFVYMVVTIPFQMGREKGLVEAAYIVPKEDEGGEEEVFNHQQLVKPSEDLINLGSKIFATQCASCHGSTGHGDGTAGQRLAVKPRNFHETADWVNGRSVVEMYHTLENGVGGNMPQFPALNPKQKYAVIHYVHNEFMQDIGWPEPTQEELDSLPAPSAAGASISINPYAETRVPVRYAMDQYAKKSETVSINPETNLHLVLGKEIYTDRCAGCHGPQGNRGVGLFKHDADWLDNVLEFRSVIEEGHPQGVKPGFPTLNDREMQALLDYTLFLQGEKE